MFPRAPASISRAADERRYLDHARKSRERLAREISGWVIPYQGIIEPISTVVLTVLPKEGSRNSELEQETSAHQSSTDLRR